MKQINLLVIIFSQILLSACSKAIFVQENRIVTYKNYDEHRSISINTDDVNYLHGSISDYPDTTKMNEIVGDVKFDLMQLAIDAENATLTALDNEYIRYDSAEIVNFRYYFRDKYKLYSDIESILIWERFPGDVFDPNYYWQLWLVNIKSNQVLSIVDLVFAADTYAEHYSPHRQTFFDGNIFTIFNPYISEVSADELSNRPFGKLLSKIYRKKLYSSYKINEEGFVEFVENTDIKYIAKLNKMAIFFPYRSSRMY